MRQIKKNCSLSQDVNPSICCMFSGARMLPRLPFVAGIVSAQVSNDGLLGNLKTTDTTNTLKSRTDWWSMTEDDLSAFPFDASENGFWNGRFLPPPPRPPLLDQKIESDGIHYTLPLLPPLQHNNF